MSIRCDQTPAWAALAAHAPVFRQRFDLRQAFAQDANRFPQFSLQAPEVFADLSKNHWDTAVREQLLALAEQTGVSAKRQAMFAGERINQSEDRAVMHWLLRQPAGSLGGDLAEPLAQVHHTLNAMLAFAEQVRADDEITDIVNIGIGGSDLGPQMAVLALQEFALPGKRFHFVSSVDGHELAGVLRGLKARSTLFLVASKTFTTAETRTNAESAKRWFTVQGGRETARHFVAITTNAEAAAAFGISTTFGFWAWVGGRYSLWSAIGLPLAIAIGAQGFRKLLAGAHAMDQHFVSAPAASNLPMQLGLLDVWYRNFLGYTSRSIAPYHSGLKRWPAYLQQLEMESNGKHVDQAGQAISYATAPVLWGEPGTNGQHAYFQMLHQGTDVVPLEFVAIKEASHDLPGHHPQLLANALAQAQALMLGQNDPAGHRHFMGNRPSTFMVLDALTPRSLGALIALQEHRVMVSGAVWGINSYDQWGVELGKVLAKDILGRLQTADTSGLDGSTAGLLKKLL